MLTSPGMRAPPSPSGLGSGLRSPAGLSLAKPKHHAPSTKHTHNNPGSTTSPSHAHAHVYRREIDHRALLLLDAA